MLAIAAAVLVAAAWLRGSEYDEQYTLFLTGGMARPEWPERVFTAGEVQALQAGHADFVTIARDLRRTDVHPPLYFWAVAAWRGVVGDGLFAARLFSVLCGLATLGAVAGVAKTLRIPVAAAVLLTLGCYGFVYINVIARGFALAELLCVGGVAMLIAARECRWLALLGGLLLGAATFTNYLAVFVGCAAIVSSSWPVQGTGRSQCTGSSSTWALMTGSTPTNPKRQWTRVAATFGFILWLPGDLWFFLAQRHSRAGQFAQFDFMAAVTRIARYAGANVFGGLPRYFTGLASDIMALFLGALLLLSVAVIVLRWRRAHPLLVVTALAPPAGLLLLGAVFDNTPIELRYMAFATPFVGLLLASTLPRPMVCAVIAIQAVALAGLMTRPETMQPARSAASAVAPLVRNGVVLVPHGNDGVGIVGAFAAESAPELRLLVIGRDETPEQIRARAAHYRRVVLALLDQDADSHATLPHMRAAFAAPCWRATDDGFNVLAFDRICGEE
jgi:4-amino-4-deoxy-L-arabinose transferase-like glycosyltransferase